MMSNLKPWMMLAITVLALLSCLETFVEGDPSNMEHPGPNASKEELGNYYLQCFREFRRKRPESRDILDVEAQADESLDTAEETSRILSKKSFTFADGSNF